MTTTLPKVGAGTLRHLAELQEKVETRTAGGGTSVTWQKVRDLWCYIKPISVALDVRAGAREPTVTHEITARQEGDIDPTKRIVFEGRAFNLVGLPKDVDERGEYVVVMATEGAAT